jgi:DNA-binding NtrC family response regulator
VDELRGRIEGAEHDIILLEGTATLRRLVGEADPNGDVLRTPLAEIEKRHILRVLSSTGGNKTRAARILGIDTKTLYNKLKSYGASAAAYRRRANHDSVTAENSRAT